MKKEYIKPRIILVMLSDGDLIATSNLRISSHSNLYEDQEDDVM